MKRLVIRFSILSVVVASGLYAIAQARHGLTSDSATDSPKEVAMADLPESAPKPIPVGGDAGGEKNPLRVTATGLPSRLGHLPPSRVASGNAGEIPSADMVLASRGQPRQPVAENRHPSTNDRYASAPSATQNLQPTASRESPKEPDTLGDLNPLRDAKPIASAATHDRSHADNAPRVASSTASSRRETRSTAAEVPAPREAVPHLATRPPEDDASMRGGEPNRFGYPTAVAERGQIPAVGRAISDTMQRTSIGNDRIPAAAQDGSGRPGARHLEGAQAPSLVIQKTAPDEIQVGKRCKFQILVRNVGQVPAFDVEIRDQIPQGTSFVSSEPRAGQANPGELAWQLGTLEGGAEATIEVELLPTAEGEIGSVATAHFQAQASVRTVATRPELDVRLSAPVKVMIGETIPLSIRVSNPGSGAATGVMLLENIPPGMSHQAGQSLEFEIGTLAPGESRELELVLTAEEAGMIHNRLIVQADANLRVEDEVEFEVIAPQLAVNVQGPKRRYLERPATYELSINNPGTAAAREIELTTYLPPGMKFVKANNAGQYDPRSHSVTWGLEELPAQQRGSVELVTLPVEIGEQRIRVEGKAERGLVDQVQQSVDVEGLAALLFTVADVNDPIEVEGETTYEIRVVNQGSKASSNLQVVALLPPDMEAVSAVGPARYRIENGRVVFEPLARLAPKADTTYQVRVKALREGDQRVRVQLLSDEMRSPVTKEESTRVYSDE